MIERPSENKQLFDTHPNTVGIRSEEWGRGNYGDYVTWPIMFANFYALMLFCSCPKAMQILSQFSWETKEGRKNNKNGEKQEAYNSLYSWNWVVCGAGLLKFYEVIAYI